MYMMRFFKHLKAKSEKIWEEKVNSLIEENSKKDEQIEELEVRLRSLQVCRALICH